MDEPLACTLHRIPGLFRRWELAELMRPGEDYHLEDAGARATARRSSPSIAACHPSGGPGMTAGASVESDGLGAATVHLTQAELAERWRVSARTLERWRVPAPARPGCS